MASDQAIDGNEPIPRMSMLAALMVIAEVLRESAFAERSARARRAAARAALARQAAAGDLAHSGAKPSLVALPRPDAGGAELPALAPGGKVAAALQDAQALLDYAARAGIPLGTDITEPLTQAHAAEEQRRWSSDIEIRFWIGLSRLAAAVQPVTAESLTADAAGYTKVATTRYFKWTLGVGGLILPLSLVMFVNNSISTEVGELLREQETAVVRLHDLAVNHQATKAQSAATGDAAGQELVARTARDLGDSLLPFARVNREIFARALALSGYVLGTVHEPWWWREGDAARRANLEVDVRLGAPEKSPSDAAFEKIATYQDIRAYAKEAQQRNLVFYGAITAYILPIAYAFLGACAFALRNLAAQEKAKVFRPSYANFARLVIAAIAGGVVGLFNNLMEGVSASPLAIAFLVGYGVEVFFSFLDAFIQTFRKAA